MAGKLLLVDDDPSVREVLRDFIALCLPEVEVVGEAEHGQEAFLVTKDRQPDVILMDIRMPILDGIAATRKILQEIEHRKKPLIITYTSYTWQELEAQARNAGAAYHFHKPFNLEDVRSILLRALRDSQDVEGNSRKI